ncbi:hypothetical protein [Halosimplex salinum]|uniref:hypothetical protein n=1 Tax=Halosimplex salinum TaxID=1710538 RepID=UPI000F47A3D6|nr:hypothetical protein [Halosimplex salinum]
MTDLERKYIENAIDLTSGKTREDLPLRGSERERHLDDLIQYFASEFPADAEGLRVSRDELENQIRGLLDESQSRGDPIEAFDDEFQHLPDRIRSIPLKNYQLGVPLNLSPQIPFDEIGFGNYRFELITKQEWTEKFADPALANPEFSDQFEQVPNSFADDYTYWVLEYEARDSEHVLEVAERYLGVILGQLIYCLFDWSYTNRFDEETVWNRPWSELRFPFVYILREGDDFHSAFFDDDISPRHTIQMYRDRQERLELRYQQIPQLNNPNEVEEKLINAFKNFQSGATEADTRQAFLDYWRTVETLCKFNEDDKMEVVAERARTIIPQQDSLLQERFDTVADKRNSLVHEKVGVTITHRDNEFLRSVVYNLIPFMIINRKWDPERINDWLDMSSKQSSELSHKLRLLGEDIEEKKRDAEMLQRILDSRERGG